MITLSLMRLGGSRRAELPQPHSEPSPIDSCWGLKVGNARILRVLSRTNVCVFKTNTQTHRTVKWQCGIFQTKWKILLCFIIIHIGLLRASHTHDTRKMAYTKDTHTFIYIYIYKTEYLQLIHQDSRHLNTALSEIFQILHGVVCVCLRYFTIYL